MTSPASASGSRWRRVALDARPLAVPAFRRIWLGTGVGMLGFQITGVAVPVQVFDITRSSAWVGALGLVGLVITEHVVLLGHRDGAGTASVPLA